MAAALPELQTGQRPNIAEQVHRQLFNKVQKLEGEQVELRVGMNRKTVAQEQQIFKARRATQAAEKQLKQQNELLAARDAELAQQNQQVGNLEQHLQQAVQQQQALQVQLYQTSGLHAQAQGYLQQEIAAAVQRIGALEARIVSEELKTSKENRLNDLMTKIRCIDNKLSNAQDMGVGSGIGMIIAGTLVAGPFGFIAGVAAAVGGGALADCSIKDLHDERKVIEAEAVALCRHLGKPLP